MMPKPAITARADTSDHPYQSDRDSAKVPQILMLPGFLASTCPGKWSKI